MKNIIFQIVLLFSLWSCPIIVNGATLHAILVSATDDASIGAGASRNHQFLKEKIMMVENKTQLEINLVELKGQEVNTNDIRKAIISLETKPDDVIWFYYSGHGVNSRTDKWAKFLIPGRKRLTLSEIFKALKAKPHRLLITVGDCCNIGGTLEGNNSPMAAKSGKVLRVKNFEKLFEKAKGDILASSSSPGQTSGYFKNVGGLYTSSFIDAFNHATCSSQDEEVTWQFIFSETAKITSDMAKVFDENQTAQWEGSEKVVYDSMNEISESANSNNFGKYIVVEDDGFDFIAVKLSKEKGINLTEKQISKLGMAIAKLNGLEYGPLSLKIGDNLKIDYSLIEKMR